MNSAMTTIMNQEMDAIVDVILRKVMYVFIMKMTKRVSVLYAEMGLFLMEKSVMMGIRMMGTGVVKYVKLKMAMIAKMNLVNVTSAEMESLNHQNNVILALHPLFCVLNVN